MWRQFVVIVTIAFAAKAIKVPVDRNDENRTDVSVDDDSDQVQVNPTPIYISDEADVDSYLIPPDPNRAQENLPDHLGTPATHLLPPLPNKQSDYFSPADPGESDWLPIVNTQPLVSSELKPPRYQQDIPIFLLNQNLSDAFNLARNTRLGKAHAERFIAPVPSVRLEPPPIRMPDTEFLLSAPPKFIDLSSQDQSGLIIQPQLLNYRKNVDAQEPTLSLRLTPPSLGPPTVKFPTKLYPKKYNSGFKPLPIPIALYAENVDEIPRAKPIKLIKPIPSSDLGYILPVHDKKLYQYQEAEQKRKIKNNVETYQPFVSADGTKDKNDGKISTEQQTSETNHRYPGRNTYSAPLRHALPAPPKGGSKYNKAPSERTEFRMHGMKGPHSYQFGYDTGKGKNRQFRYEERDNDGVVKGHYGYMDKFGKLRIVNYSAHPELGFHAEAPVEEE